MDKKTLDQLENIVDSLVDDSSVPFKEKAEAIKAHFDDNGNMNLEEFISWFDGMFD